MRPKNILLKQELFKDGLTQRWLSKKTKIPENQISQHITGRFNFSERQKHKIAKALGKQIKDLFEME